MIPWAVEGIVFLGAALMVYNIICFVRFARNISGTKTWDKSSRILAVPIVLLVLFLLGYVVIGVWGDPNWVMGMVLLGGSVFVLVMYLMLDRIVKRILENEHLEAQLLAAEESARVKNSFLSSISHEMRTPLNAILGLSRLSKEDRCMPAESREQMEKIEKSGMALLRLINNILDMNQIETGQLTVVRREFSLEDVLMDINDETQSLCYEKGLEYRFTQQPEAEGRYMGDDSLLGQVLSGILDNAVKFTDAPGRVTFDVACAASEGDRRELTFTVTDTGVGMSPEFMQRLFEPFAQEDATSTNRFGGAGLSLAAAKQKVELMGGAIDVSSRKQAGTSFTVTLSLELCPEREREELSPLEGRRILVVDDVAVNAEIVGDLLELEGALPDFAENGQEALDMFTGSEPDTYDAILMDLRMPVMDGLESARRIRELERPDARTIPIITVTANAFESDVRKTLEAGMNAHLAKPVEPEILYETVGRLIARREAEGE